MIRKSRISKIFNIVWIAALLVSMVYAVAVWAGVTVDIKGNYVTTTDFAKVTDDTTNWNTAYGWGDWSTDFGKVTDDTTNWNTAYGWGDWSTTVGKITDDTTKFHNAADSVAAWDNGNLDSTNVLNGGLTLDDLGQHGASSGQVIKWDGSAWNPGTDNAGATSLEDVFSYMGRVYFDTTGNHDSIFVVLADSADKALADAGGNTITSTYETITNVGKIGDDTTNFLAAWDSVQAWGNGALDSVTVKDSSLSYLDLHPRNITVIINPIPAIGAGESDSLKLDWAQTFLGDNHDFMYIFYNVSTVDDQSCSTFYSYLMPAGAIKLVSIDIYQTRNTGTATTDASWKWVCWKRSTIAGAKTDIDSVTTYNTSGAYTDQTMNTFGTNATAGNWIGIMGIPIADQNDSCMVSLVTLTYYGYY